MTTVSNTIRPFSAFLNQKNIEIANKYSFARGGSILAAVIITPIAIVETIATLSYALLTSFIHTITLAKSKKMQNHVINVWAHAFNSFATIGAVGHLFANMFNKKDYYNELSLNCIKNAMKLEFGFNKIAGRQSSEMPAMLSVKEHHLMHFIDKKNILPLDQYKNKVLIYVDEAVGLFFKSPFICDAVLSGLKKRSDNIEKTDIEILMNFKDDLKDPLEEAFEYTANLAQYLELLRPLNCPSNFESTGNENRDKEIIKLKKEIQKLSNEEKRLLIENLFFSNGVDKIGKIASKIKVLASPISNQNILDNANNQARFYLQIVESAKCHFPETPAYTGSAGK